MNISQFFMYIYFSSNKNNREYVNITLQGPTNICVTFVLKVILFPYTGCNLSELVGLKCNIIIT